jgi:hypothetical protein
MIKKTNDFVNIQGISRVVMSPDEIENATHITFEKLTWIFIFRFKNIVR